MLGNARILFKRIHFWCYFIFFLLYIPVLSNHVTLSLHLWSNINPWLWVRVHSAGFSLSILLENSYHSPGPNFNLIFLDSLKGKYSPVSENVIRCLPQKEVPWCSGIYLLSKDNHWVSFLDNHNIFCINAGPSYYFDFFSFPPFGSLGWVKTVLGIGVLIRWGEG